MSRIHTPVSVSDAPEDAQPTLEAVNNLLGSAPNMFRIISNSSAALKGYVGFNSALGAGRLPVSTREGIALAVAEVNGCDYCLAAHTYLGQNVTKLTSAEIARNQQR